jgi:predicted phosphodiesterase
MGMLNILCIGDPHYKVSNVKETTEFETKLYQYLANNKPDLIVCMGDVLDRHETIHVNPLERATSFLRSLTTFAQTYVLIGNHDRPNNSTFLTDEHGFNALKHWIVDDKHHPITVVDTVIIREHDEHKLVFVPYVPPGRFLEALSIGFGKDIVDKPDVSALFSHQEFYGSDLGSQMKSSNGDKWHCTWPPIFNGHIHDYGQPQGNIYNVGTPFQHAFGDREDKTLSLITLFPNGTYEHQRISLNLTKKKVIELHAADVPNYIPDPQYQTKIVVIGNSAELKQVAKLYQVKQLMNNGVKVVYKDSGETAAQVQRLNVVDKSTTYMQRLYQEIQSQPNLVEVFHQLFGKPKQPKLILRVV